MKAMKSMASTYDSNFNAWDYFVAAHRAATLPATEVHAGWKFFPWHRELVNRFASELGRALGRSAFFPPYWDWTDAQSNDAINDENYLGPARGEYADFPDGYVVERGNFGKGNWSINASLASLPGEKKHGALLRATGNGLQMCLDPKGRSWTLDTPYNPPHVDSLTVVGPFTYLPSDGPPSTTERFL